MKMIFSNYSADDADTKVIVMYLEDIHDGRRFMEIAKRITMENKKPIIVLKAGRTPEGAKAHLPPVHSSGPDGNL